MKKYEQVKLSIIIYSANDVVRTSTIFDGVTTQGDFFDLDAFNNAKEAGE